MPKGYWVVRVDVNDAAEYQKYVAANGPPIAAFGGRFLVRGGRSQTPEGQHRARTVVLEFPSFQAAQDCYHSPAYQEAMKLRHAASAADFLIIEGYGGPQPGN
jgi:uncharacterized protein (DUF1330 family)